MTLAREWLGSINENIQSKGGVGFQPEDQKNIDELRSSTIHFL